MDFLLLLWLSKRPSWCSKVSWEIYSKNSGFFLLLYSFPIPRSFTAWGQNLSFCNTSKFIYVYGRGMVTGRRIRPSVLEIRALFESQGKLRVSAARVIDIWGSRDDPLLRHFIDWQFLPLSRSISGLLPGSPMYLRRETWRKKLQVQRRNFIRRLSYWNFSPNRGFLSLYFFFWSQTFETTFFS